MIFERLRSALPLAVVFMVLLAMVMPVVPALGAAGFLSLSPIQGVVGTATTVIGTGYANGGTITVTFDSVPVTSGTVIAGNFSGLFYVPPVPRGVHTVTASTSLGDTTAAPATFTVIPDINLNLTSGYGGDQINVNGSGFNGSTTVTLYFDGTAIGSTTSGINGSFSGFILTIPQAARGNHTVNANDGVGPTSTYAFTVSPRLTVTPSSGSIGSQLTIVGTGFAANSTMSFYMDDVLVTTPATNTSSTGSFTLSAFAVPATSYGTHTIKAQDAGGGSASGTFTATQIMKISPESGTAGTTVNITGSGFGASKNMNITFRGAPALTSPPTVTADASGNFSASLTIPSSGGGIHQITVSDGSITSTANFTIKSTVKPLSSNKGNVGTTVTVEGNGFNAQGIISIRWDAAQVAAVTADANGAFSASFRVPNSKAGDHRILVTDGVNSQELTFNVTASAGLSQSSGYVGGDVTVSGSGFLAGATVNITYDGVRITSTTSDASGNFSAIFRAPISKGGNHLIAASDGTNTITNTFTMDSVPPPAPILLQPENKTKADELPNFVWTGVDDPSGVVYIFQLATDKTFNAIVLEKKDMPSAGYKVTEKEKLPSRSAQEPYYWRVRAIDTASNESDWSTVNNFFVGFVMPQWAFYAIAGAAVVIFFLLGFWLGRRTSGMSGDEGGIDENMLKI